MPPVGLPGEKRRGDREPDSVFGGNAELKSASLYFGLIGITVGLAIFTLVILLSGRFLRRFLGEIGLGLLTRLLGRLVAAIRMQFLITGSTEVIVETIAPKLMRLGQ